MTDAEEWYFHSGGETHGPMSWDALRSHAQRGAIGPDTLIGRAGESDWIAARELPDLLPSASFPPVIVKKTRTRASENRTRASSPVPVPNDRSYPSLLLAARLYSIFALLTVAFGAVLALGIGYVALDRVARNKFDFEDLKFLLAAEFVVLWNTFFGWLSLRTAAEMIRLTIHLEHNTQATAQACQEISKTLRSR